ncbi:MAG: hypothetical protein KKH99_08575 [Proteobacteria bacterium]|nr:hypothetical protein [Pseudomonadota bacterium]
MKNGFEYIDGDDKRTDPRNENQKNASVEFYPANTEIAYHFKLKDFSSKGFGILVRKDSKVLMHIKSGDVLDMKYYPDTAAATPSLYRTQIKHISEPEPGKHKEHMMVGLMILEQAEIA